MQIKHYIYSSIILLAFVLSSCNSNSKDDKSDDARAINSEGKTVSSFDISIKYAQGFSVEKFDNYHRVIVHNPWQKGNDIGVYILAQKNEVGSIELQENEVLIELPLEHIAIMSASNVGYFSLLEKIHQINAVADKSRLYNKNLRYGIELGNVKVLGNSEIINVEELLLANSDIFLQTAYEASSGKDQALIDGGILVVYNIDWMEKTPLARAEWIKFVGLLCNENQKADSIFKLIENNYIQLKYLADTLDYKPDVLIGGLYKDVWYMPGGKSFKAYLLADAGTNYHWITDSTEGSLALSFETVMEQQLNAAVWIEVPFESKEELLISDERYAYFDAFKIGSIYHHSKRSNDSGGNDYWEMGLCRPDEILADLIRIFHPEVMEDGELKYYDRVK